MDSHFTTVSLLSLTPPVQKIICQCIVPMTSKEHHFTFMKNNSMETKFGFQKKLSHPDSYTGDTLDEYMLG